MEPAPTNDFLIGLAEDLLVCLRFCTRLPIPAFAFETTPHDASLSTHARLLPLAGAIIGAIAAFVLWLSAKLGLPPSLAALLSIASLIVVTGSLHEDGLADFADATGGVNPEQRLAIMKDARLGTFGVLALILSVLARVASIWFLARHNFPLACLVLISTAATSRALALLPLYVLPAARPDGAGFSATTPQETTLAVAAPIAFVLGLLPLLAGVGFGRVLIALILSVAAAYGVTHLARRLLEGQTGDIAGTTQQAVEIIAYLVYAAQL